MVTALRGSGQSPHMVRLSALEIRSLPGSIFPVLCSPSAPGAAWEETMRGLMSDRPLLVTSLIEHAARYHGDVEIVSRLVDGATHRYSYAEAERRSHRLARALLRLGV